MYNTTVYSYTIYRRCLLFAKLKDNIASTKQRRENHSIKEDIWIMEKETNNDRKEEMLPMIDAIIYRINFLCDKNDMSIYELAKLSGLSQSTLNEIMQRRSTKPRFNTLSKIAFGLGMDLKEFFDDPVFERIKGIHDQERPERIKPSRRRRNTETEKDD